MFFQEVLEKPEEAGVGGWPLDLKTKKQKYQMPLGDMISHSSLAKLESKKDTRLDCPQLLLSRDFFVST
jgi:hypothetical protein